MNSRNIQIVLLAALTLTIAACDPSESVGKEATEPGYLTEEIPPCTPVPGSPVDQSDAERQGAFIGEARCSGSSTIVAHVNGHPITAADIAEGRAGATVNLDRMRDTIPRVVPDSQAYASPQGTPLAPGEGRLTDKSDGPIPESSGMRKFMTERIDIVEEHGVDAAVLAQVVTDIARFTAATAAGHSADPADIAARVAELKTAIEEGLIPELEGYLSAVDEDVYFGKLLPARLAKDLAIASWREELLADVTSTEEARRVWRQAEGDALANVQVTLTGEPGLDVTLEELTAYMDAYWDLDAPPPPPAQPSPSCDLIVPDVSENPDLTRDCMVLLAAKDELRGTGTLNWSVDTAISSWDGVTTGGTPIRVTKVELDNESLTGNIPARMGELSELTHLDLSSNSLTGDIPAELGWLSNLTEIKLSGNSLTGCIPLGLKDVATSDLSSLNLPYCRPPVPGTPTAGTATETSLQLSWTAVAGASKYRVEYFEDKFALWTVDDDAITTTTHTTDGLLCGREYQFRVSAYGSGTTYAAAWSDSSEALTASTGDCTAK